MLDFARAYRFVFTSQKWYLNILFGILGLIVPIAGQIVLVGYLYEQIEAWHRRKDDSTYQDLEVTGDALIRYLTRGCWPFLVHFILMQAPMMALGMGFGIYVMSHMSLQPGKPPDLNWMISAYAVFYPIMFTVAILVSLIVVPMQLRAGLAQDFKAAFSLSFVGDFIRRTVGTMLVMLVVQMILVFLLGLGGLVLCFVGMFFTAAWGTFAQYHLYFQLYETYLERGGTPIPLKDPPAARGTPPVTYA